MNTPLRQASCNNKPATTTAARAHEIALRRLQLLQIDGALRRKGLTVAESARECGSSVPTLWRYRKNYDAMGLEGLEPRFAFSGPPSALKKLGVTAETVREVQRLNAILESNQKAWRQFAKSPRCPPALAAFLESAKNIPLSLLAETRLKRFKAVGFKGQYFVVVALPV